MRKYYNQIIKETLHTSRGALEKMVEMTFGNIGKPMKIDKVDDAQKIFLGLRAKKIKNFFE